MASVRTSAKAIIIRDRSLLVIEHLDDVGEWFSLPGGGQDPGETLISALRRECQEELGVDVEVGAIRFVREYIGANHEFRDEDSDIHQVEFLFECQLIQSIDGASPSKPDPRQVALAWLPLDSLGDYRLYPSPLRALLSGLPSDDGAIYLGDVN